MSENDYKLFGLDNKTATISQAKNTYYNLALLIHPDRNISVNKEEACKEMCSLTNSYNNIIKDITNRNRNHEITNCDNLKIYHQNNQTDLDNYMKNMPSFTEIFHETHDDMQKFNQKWFEKNEQNRGDIDENQFIIDLKSGYQICKSEYSYIDSNDNDLEYSTEIILDKDFNDFNYSKERSLIHIDDLNSINASNHADYKDAFQSDIMNTIPLSIINKYSLNENNNILEEFEKIKIEYLENVETKKQKNFIKELNKLNSI